MIKIKNLKLRFPQSINLSIDELFIEEGRIFSIIGPNGAGKTTLLNIIALFQKPDDGNIEIWGQNILNMKDVVNFRRKISFVFSQPYLFCGTVYDNIALPLRLRGVDGAKAVDEMLGLFKIGHLKSNMAKTLSQGEKYRLSLARAFVSRPKLLLLDEPFLSLDRVYKESLINDLRGLIKPNGVSVIFVTQDQTEALTLADTIAVMKDGSILQQGEPQHIFTMPASKEVADFIGAETLVEGMITRKEDNLCFIKAGDNFLEVVSTYNEGDRVLACIRPEDVIIARQIDSNSARNHFKAKIIDIKPWGLEYKLNLYCGFNLIASVTKQSIKNMDLKVKDEVFAVFKATAIHLIKR